jgi:hypothetical protein
VVELEPGLEEMKNESMVDIGVDDNQEEDMTQQSGNDPVPNPNKGKNLRKMLNIIREQKQKVLDRNKGNDQDIDNQDESEDVSDISEVTPVRK